MSAQKIKTRTRFGYFRRQVICRELVILRIETKNSPLLPLKLVTSIVDCLSDALLPGIIPEHTITTISTANMPYKPEEEIYVGKPSPVHL